MAVRHEECLNYGMDETKNSFFDGVEIPQDFEIYKAAQGIYLSFTERDFFLDFWAFTKPNAKNKVIARIVLNPVHLKEIILVCQMQLQKFQELRKTQPPPDESGPQITRS